MQNSSRGPIFQSSQQNFPLSPAPWQLAKGNEDSGCKELEETSELVTYSTCSSTEIQLCVSNCLLEPENMVLRSLQGFLCQEFEISSA